NLASALGAVNEKFPLTVYLSDSVAQAQKDAIKSRLGADIAVAGFDYTSKEQALKAFKGANNSEAALIQGIGGNPLPASFDVRLKAGSAAERAKKLVADLSKMGGVEEVQFLQDEAGKLKSLLDAFSFGGLAAGLGVFIGVLFISYSTLKLAVVRHIDEVEVLKLMGSPRSFIMAPFLLEGLLQGVVASGIAIAILYGLLTLAGSGALSFVPAGATLVFMPFWAWGGLVAAGGLLGLSGSFFAFFKTLKM
ncbi:MAG TPA: permease-like cell division protein FtsX, partial [Nitrospirota bacterium]